MPPELVQHGASAAADPLERAGQAIAVAEGLINAASLLDSSHRTFDRLSPPHLLSKIFIFDPVFLRCPQTSTVGKGAQCTCLA
jgi:hypothetical protein